MTIHTVVQGENIDVIAFKHGFHPATLWEHDENQKLRDKRKDPNLLMADDEVFIPDRKLREETVHTGKRHTFYRSKENVREEEKKKKKKKEKKKVKKKGKEKKKKKKGEEEKKKKVKKKKGKERVKKKDKEKKKKKEKKKEKGKEEIKAKKIKKGKKEKKK